MRVLIIAHGLPPRTMGGAELYASAHATALARGGDRVLVLAREANPERDEFTVTREQKNGVDIAWINNTFSATRSFADTYTDDRIDAVAAGLVDEFKPDVAHVHHLTCLSTTLVRELAVRHVPVFCTLHDYWLLCHRGQLLDRDLQHCSGPPCNNCLGPEASAPAAAFAGRAALKTAERFLPTRVFGRMRGAALRVTELASTSGGRGRDAAAARRDHMRGVMDTVTHFFAPSRHLRDRFVAAGLNPSRISVSEYGWSLPQSAVRSTPALIPHRLPLRVGFLGSLMVSKAPHLLLEACSGLPAGSCVVHLFGDHSDYHGDRSYRDELAPLLGLPGVNHHGRIDRDRLATVFEQIDVLAIPSIWPENSPLVIREAFLSGVPVVASQIAGIPETVSDGVNGLLFAPGNIVDLRHVLGRLIEEPELLTRLRAGIPKVRTVEDDVTSMRVRYEQTLRASVPKRRLAAVVLNYETPDDTFLATRSLLLSRRPIDHVIVVDNSEDISSRRASARRACVDVLSPFLDRISFLPTGKNLGFSGGMNAGISKALESGADAVLLVNSDVVVPVDCVDALERALYASPGAGIAGPLVLGRKTPDRIASNGISYNETTGRMRHRDVGVALSRSPAPAARGVEAVSGCLMLVRREVFEAAGSFDPACFFSFEDLDFCLRARDAGFASIVVPAATALHEGGRSIGADAPRRFYFGVRNHLWLARRRGGPGGRAAAAARSSYVVALNFAHAFRAPGGTLAGRLWATAQGTRDYFRGRFGSGDR